MSYKEFLDSFLLELKNKYVVDFDPKASNDRFLVLRSSITTAKEAESFIKDFGLLTNTQWIVYKGNAATHTRIVYNKLWICQHSSHRKKNVSNRNLNCKAKISITVKKLTEHTKKKDQYLCATIPLCCKIIIDCTHTHDINNTDTLKLLRVSDEVRKQFLSYFDDGFSPKEAKRYHEKMLLMSENYLVDFVNTAKNPTDRQVLYIYDRWKNKNLRSATNPFEKLLQKKDVYEEKDGGNGLKRQRLKRNAVPSRYLPVSCDDTNEKDDNVNSRKINKTKPKNALLTKKKQTLLENFPAKKEVLCSEEANSNESTGNQEANNKTSSNFITIKNEETTDTEPCVTQVRIIVPNYSDIDTNTIEPTSKNVEKYIQNSTVSLLPMNLNEKSKLDYSIFKSSPNDSKEILTKKLDTMVSVNELLQKKTSFFQNKCKMYETEVNIMKGVIDNLKQINSATFDN